MNYSSDNEEDYRHIMDRVVQHLIREEITISVMESCTGGLFSSALTDTEGVSAVFLGSFVTYSNEAKTRNGVPARIIDRYGVYSPETAEAMAEACRTFYGADVGVGITGTTGNKDPNNGDSVLGEIFYAILWGKEKCIHRLELKTDGLARREIKERTVKETAKALAGLLGLDDCEK